jgi:hypothetical protein
MKGARDKTNMLGECMQPINGGKFKPVLQIMERDDGPDIKTKMFAATRGPCFFGGCSELCCSSEFGISKAKDGMGVNEIHKLQFDYATITKLKPKGLGQVRVILQLAMHNPPPVFALNTILFFTTFSF